MRGRPNYYILDENHVAIPTNDVNEWGRCREGDRHIGLTEMGDIRVSTVFLGLDHNWGNGPPLIFETMVFGGLLDEEQDRYSTWDEAKIGHEAMCERVRHAQEDDK